MWLTLSNAFEKSVIPGKILDQHGEMCFTWPVFSKTMPNIVKQVMFVHVLKDLPQDTNEGNWSVVGSQ